MINRLRDYREAQLALNFFYVATHLSPRLKSSILSFRSQSESFYLWKSTLTKNRWFCVLRHNPYSPKILKSAIIIIYLVIQTDFCQQLHVTVSIENVTTVEEY